MGNIISSFFSGFGKVLGSLFGSPMEFLSGKSCDSVCGTWDLICYIENFCIANLLKLLMVLVLFYFVLLFFYLLHKTGICYCIGRSLCKMVWACFAACFYICEYGCRCLCYNTGKLRGTRRRNRRQFEQNYYDSDYEESTSHSKPRSIERTRSLSSRSRKLRRSHLEKSLRPRSHKVQIGISKNGGYVNSPRDSAMGHKHVGATHDVKVTKTSKFIKKGANIERRVRVSRRPRLK